jgi:hypothetical protein
MRKLVLILFCLIARPALALDASVGTTTTCSSWLQERAKLATFLHGNRPGDMPQATLGRAALEERLCPLAGAGILEAALGPESGDRNRNYELPCSRVDGAAIG